MAKSILLIVEGDSDEAPFFRRMFEKSYKNLSYKIYSYHTTIHTLAQELYNNYPCFEDDQIDIQAVLASIEIDTHKKKMLLAKYTDIFMVFDFDPQHDHPHFDTVMRMICYFNDSTLHGKLFINYPMMQSYKHFSFLPDDSFADRIVQKSEVNDYKKIVGNVSKYTNLSSFDYVTFVSLAVHHIRKSNLILNGRYELPQYDEYLNFDHKKIYEIQLKNYIEEEKVLVLNTCIMVLCDFAPERFLTYVKTHQQELNI